MKKAKRKAADELPSEYKRSDFGNPVRGKYAARVAAETEIVVLEPQVAEAFQTRARSTRRAETSRHCGDHCTPDTALNRTRQTARWLT